MTAPYRAVLLQRRIGGISGAVVPVTPLQTTLRICGNSRLREPVKPVADSD
jgi:hypothetical protein